MVSVNGLEALVAPTASKCNYKSVKAGRVATVFKIYFTPSSLIGLWAKLKGLRLSYDFNNIENDGGKLLGEALTGLTELVELSINVGTKNFGFPGFNAIA
jgi:hypothetical protein